MNEKEHILIVDDDEGTRKSLALIFGKKSYIIETASTGQEALKKVQDKFFNVVLLDIKLPDVEGIELLASLKELQPDTVVIMVTGYPTMDTAMRAVNEGAAAYITKPLNMNEVLTTIREAIERQKIEIQSKMLYQKAQQESTVHSQVNQISIIIGERDSLTRHGICSTIHNAGFELAGVSDNSDDFLELVTMHKPEIVIVNFDLPGLNKEVLISRIRDISPKTNILVLCDDSCDAETKFKCFTSSTEAGATGFVLTSQITPEQLINAITNVQLGGIIAYPEIVQQTLHQLKQSEKEIQNSCPLNTRELEILQLVSRGMSDKQIAEHMSLTKRTTHGHLHSIFTKMGVGSRTEAIYKALKNGWINLS